VTLRQRRSRQNGRDAHARRPGSATGTPPNTIEPA
jgi:hypothetical protein